MKDSIKKILLFIILIIIVLIIILSFVFINKKKETPKVSKEKYIDNIVNDVFFEKNVTIDELNDATDTKLIKNDIFIGKDSELRYRPSEKLIKKYKLKDYIPIQDKLAGEVEKRALNNIEYKVIDKNEDDNYIEYEIKPWYAYKYLRNVEYLKEMIMEDAGFVSDVNTVFTEEYEINNFKSRVIALRVLSNHLSDYDNINNEKLRFSFYFNGNKAKEFEFYSLYYNLQGATSKESPDRMSFEQIDQEKARMKKYLEEAITNGLYDKSNPYKV